MTIIRNVVCQREPYSVRDSASVFDAIEFMASRNIGAICVLDEADKLCGIFSERDLLQRVIVAGLDPATLPIKEVMSAPRAVINCDETPHEALERMEQFGVRHLPVMDGDKWVGMLSMRDIMRVEINDQDAELRLLHEYIQH